MALNVKYTHEGDIHTIELGIVGLEKIIIDYTGVPLEQRTGIAKALLAASNLACYATALEKALYAREVQIESIVAESSLTLGQTEVGEERVKAIAIDAVVKMDEAGSVAYARCAKIMEKGCLITKSVNDGIAMSYALKADYKK